MYTTVSSITWKKTRLLRIWQFKSLAGIDNEVKVTKTYANLYHILVSYTSGSLDIVDTSIFFILVVYVLSKSLE